MKRRFAALPLLTQISALIIGFPLVALGLMQTIMNVAAIIRLHSVVGAPHDGLAVGPLFAMVGASFLWPLFSFGPHQPH